MSFLIAKIQNHPVDLSRCRTTDDDLKNHRLTLIALKPCVCPNWRYTMRQTFKGTNYDSPSQQFDESAASGAQETYTSGGVEARQTKPQRGQYRSLPWLSGIILELVSCRGRGGGAGHRTGSVALEETHLLQRSNQQLIDIEADRRRNFGVSITVSLGCRPTFCAGTDTMRFQFNDTVIYRRE